MWFEREITNKIVAAAKTYPVVAVTGPRQSGKTTLIKSIFADMAYVNLESPEVREAASDDPRKFLGQFPDGVILDEIQQIPELLSYIQIIVDSQKSLGKFILTGSHQLLLHQAISQSLAGRVAIFNLLPLTINELAGAKIDLSLDEYLFSGFFPRIYADKLEVTMAYRNYFQTYVERDVRQIINLKNIRTFQKFVRLCAGRIGSVVNKESLGNDLGISGNTVNEWLSILEVSFVIFLLPPFFENFGKRITKAPKLYFTDVGLATYLLGIENIAQLSRDPLRGFLVENLVILELLKTRLNQGLEPQLYYYRDHQKNEVDLIFKTGHQLVPIEIKSSQTYHKEFLKGLHYYKNLVGERIEKSFLVYAGDIEQAIHEIQLLNFKNSATIINSGQNS